MPPGYQPRVELLTQKYLGVDTVNQFSQIPSERSPSMQNAWAPKLGAIGKRPGSAPISTSALPSTIEHLTTYKTSASAASAPEIYAAAGVTLYKFDGVDTLEPLTMTDALVTADIHSIGFTNSSLTSRLLIADGGDLKECDGSTVVDVIPASDDPSPAPANVLSDINGKGCKFIWEHSGHVFISPGTNEVFYSKRYDFDYFPEVRYFFLVNNNDYVHGNGVSYDGRCLVPMRRSWSIITGSTFEDFEATEFLNTVHGCIAPRSIQKITYPDGTQTIAYLSDFSVHEIFTSIFNDTSRLYATRDLMKDKINFEGLNLTESEKEEAIGFFDAKRSLYLLSFKRDDTDYTYAYDTRTQEWYTDWTGFNAKTYTSLDSTTFFAGSLKHLCKFDNNLYSDWNDKNKTSGTPVHFKRYSPLLSLEKTGYASYFDYYIIEMRRYDIPATLDVTVIFVNSSELGAETIDTNAAVWDATEWDVAQWANEDYTETVNEPRRIVYKKKSRYVQVLWENSLDEPVEVYWDKFQGRQSGQ